MDCFVYSSRAERLTRPYLLLATQSSDRPAHPHGAQWSFWRKVAIDNDTLGVDPVYASIGLRKNGYFITN